MTDTLKLATEVWQTSHWTSEQLKRLERFAELVAAPLKAENEALRREIQNQYRCIKSHAEITQKAEADAERWRYSVTIGGNQTMNWLDVYSDWDGDGDFTDQIDAARAKEKTP
jgi:hypothetical protein